MKYTHPLMIKPPVVSPVMPVAMPLAYQSRSVAARNGRGKR